MEEERLDDGVKGRHLVPSQRTSVVQYLSCPSSARLTTTFPTFGDAGAHVGYPIPGRAPSGSPPGTTI